MSHEEISFCELKAKDIVNELDGRKLGRVSDLVFSPRTGCVLGIVAPISRRGFFLRGQEIYIPFKHIVKIGPDVVLVRLPADLSNQADCINVGAQQKPRPRGFEGEFGAEHHDNRVFGADHGELKPKAAPPPPPSPAGSPECDFKCEKCMLFDCDRRWKGGEGRYC